MGEFLNKICVVQKMIEEQNLEEASQHYTEDVKILGPGESDVINGRQELIAAWKGGAEILPKLQWDEPFLDGNVCVRRGHLDNAWKFECRIWVEDNKVKECTTTTIA